MASGILGILSYLNRNKDADLELARRMQEINAQGAVNAALQQTITQETLLRNKDEEARKQQVLLDAFYKEALKNGATSQMAFQEAQNKLAQYLGAQPSSDIAKSGVDQAEFERQKRISIGGQPGAVALGSFITDAGIKKAQAGAMQDAVTAATARGQLPLAEATAARQGVANLNRAGLDVHRTSALLPTESARAADTADLELQQNQFRKDVMAHTNPALAGEAVNAENQANIARSGLTAETGGLTPGPLTLAPSTESDYYDRFANALENAVRRMRDKQQTPTGGLPVRLNIRMLTEPAPARLP